LKGSGKTVIRTGGHECYHNTLPSRYGSRKGDKTFEPNRPSAVQLLAQHCQLGETVRYIADFTSPGNISETACEADDTSAQLVLNFVLKALLATLHEGLLKGKKTSISARQKCANEFRTTEGVALQRALEIAQIAQTSVFMERAKASVFVSWTIYVAIQSNIRYQRRSSLEEHHGRNRSVSTCSTDSSAFGCSSTGDNLSHQPTVEGDNGLATAALAGALVLDSFNAPQYTLLEWNCRSPIAMFFSNQIALELDGSAGLLEERAVRLTDFAADEAVRSYMEFGQDFTK
jgi:hypothetical protein